MTNVSDDIRVRVAPYLPLVSNASQYFIKETEVEARLLLTHILIKNNNNLSAFDMFFYLFIYLFILFVSTEASDHGDQNGAAGPASLHPSAHVLGSLRSTGPRSRLVVESR